MLAHLSFGNYQRPSQWKPFDDDDVGNAWPSRTSVGFLSHAERKVERRPELGDRPSKSQNTLPTNLPTNVLRMVPAQGLVPVELRRRSIGGDVPDREFSGPTILFGVEGHLLAFTQASDSGSLQGRDMDKHVIPPTVW